MESLYELCDIADCLDADTGVDLKHPKKKGEPKHVYKKKLAEAADGLLAALYEVNGIDESYYLDENGWVRDSESINFEALSNLNWGSVDARFDMSSQMFRYRFVSRWLQYVIESLPDIIDSQKNPIAKHESKAIAIDSLVSDVISFSDAMFDENPITTRYIETSAKINVCVGHPSEYVNLIPQFIKVLTRPEPTPAAVIKHQFCCLAYMLAVGKTKSKFLPGIRAYEHGDFTKIVEKLGAEIADKGPERFTIGYEAFIQASPKIMTRATNMSNAFKLGVYALAFAAFVCDNDIAYDRLNAIL